MTFTYKAATDAVDSVMNNEMIKAVRLVNGLTPDLRVNIRPEFKDKLWNFLDANAAGIFGIDFAISRPAPTDDNWSAYEKALNYAVRLIRGQ